MKIGSGPARRRFLVPEVVQSSAMDCGPAALKSLFEGYGIPVSYGRLREACQTDVDGTSIDTLEEIARQLGLRAEQIMLPADHLLLSEARALPALVVVRQPEGSTHFLVVWSHAAGVVQVMDPGRGRTWLSATRLLQELYQHVMPVPAAAWREWARSEDALAALGRRIRSAGLSARALEVLTRSVSEDPDWRGLATLDAASRATTSLVRAGGLRRGREAERALEGLFAEARAAWPDPRTIIPQAYWSVREQPTEDGHEEQVLFRGAVAVRVLGRSAQAVGEPHAPSESPPLSRELEAARREEPIAPARELLRRLSAEGKPGLATLLAGLFVAAGTVVVEALLLRGVLELAPLLGLSGQRLAALGALVGFVLLALVLELPLRLGELRLGRRLEARLRIAFQEKLPRLADRYFHSRLTSDMAERGHSLQALRLVPRLGGLVAQTGFELVLTTAGIVWLAPADAWLAVLAAFAALVLPLVFQSFLAERDLRVRAHVAGLGRFYLDALLGLVAVRAHGAERALRGQHEGLLTEWARARLDLQRAAVLVQAVQALAGYSLAAALLLSHVRQGGDVASVLLLVYWALKLPVLGQTIAQGAWQYPALHNVTLRMLEPLGAPEVAEEGREETEAPTSGSDGEPGGETLAAVSIRMRDVGVVVAGHTILEGVNLEIAAGSHVAVVGSSGAGKTSLLGLLLGWHRPATGTLLVDGEPLRGSSLRRLRSHTAWVDPAVRLWNGSFLDNLRYGNSAGLLRPLAQVIDTAELRPLLEVLPEGHQTMLGEGGGLVSGGEGQRVRLGRALLRPAVRLAILDEPFRGLDRPQRARLLARVREQWRHATLLCVTHDVAETRNFDRVLVVDGGRVVEDGTPDVLAEEPGSRYRHMLDAERAVRRLWAEMGWRRMRLESGRVREGASGAGN